MNRLDEIRGMVAEIERTNPRELQHKAPFEVREVKDSGAGQNVYTIKGLASVYGRPSLDLGGFTERIAPGAFDAVLATDPHVLHLWDHDTRFSLSSTQSTQYPLELTPEQDGLGFFSRVAPTTYAQDLRTLIEGDIINQSSFAFTVGEDDWQNIDGKIERTVVEVDGLFDVTTCAMGAYPQTTSELALRSVANGAKRFSVAIPVAIPEVVASSDGPAVVAPEVRVGEPVAARTAADPADIARLKHQAEVDLRDARERLYRRSET